MKDHYLKSNKAAKTRLFNSMCCFMGKNKLFKKYSIRAWIYHLISISEPQLQNKGLNQTGKEKFHLGINILILYMG